MFAFKLAFAGLGHLIAHWSIGLIIIAVCVVIEFASGWVVGYLPILKTPIEWCQKKVLFVAVGTALVLFGEYLGASDLADRCDARAAVVTTKVHDAVTKAKTHVGRPIGETDK